MILIDSRKDEGSKLYPIMKGMGIPCERYQLEFGDVAFEGRSPQGNIMIGFERKTLHDMLNSIDSKRLSGFQLPGMRAMYGQTFLIMEGHWKPDPQTGRLLEGFNAGTCWKPCTHPGNSSLMYAKLRRYLFSIEMSGVHVMITRDIYHTAYDICEAYHWFQKAEHTAMLDMQRIIVPSLDTNIPLVRKWAQAITDVGPKIGDAAARYFKKPIRLAQADESEWLRAGISGVGVKTAQNIVREIRGSL